MHSKEKHHDSPSPPLPQPRHGDAMTKRRYLTPAQKQKLRKQQNYRCLACDKLLLNNADNPTEYDHIIPLGLGGSNDLDNWQATHMRCHKPKTVEDMGRIAKAKRMERKQALTPEAKAERARRKGKKPQIKSPGFDKRWKRKVSGKTERRQPCGS